MNDLKKIWLNNIPIQLLILLAVSFWVIISQQGQINRDGVLYLTEAQAILNLDWQQTMSLSRWPFFALLVAMVHQFTGITLLHAAHLINVLMFLLASLFFLKTIRLLTTTTTVIYGTAILLTAIPLMDDYLGMVLRDQGQWAGFMIGVYFYLRWIKRPQWTWAVLWQLGFIFGTLFRPECLMFNILLPLTHQLFIVKNEHIQALIQSVSIPLVGLSLLTILWFIWGIDASSIDFGRLNEIVHRPKSFLNNIFQPLAIETKNYYLKVLIADYATSFKYFFLSYVAVYKWAAGLGLLHLFLFGYALKQRLIPTPYLKALAIFFALSSIITIINLYSTFVIASRYWVMNFWVVYIVAAIGLGHLWRTIKNSKHSKQRWMMWGLVSILGLYFFNVIIDKPEPHFEQQAGRWVKEQQLDLNNIYFNHNRIAYYAGLLAYDITDLKTATEVIKYQYLMMRFDRFSKIKQIPNYQSIEYFPSQDNPKVIIYRRIDND